MDRLCDPVHYPMNSASSPDLTIHGKNTCAISPIGGFEQDLLHRVGREISETYSHQTSIRRLLNIVDFAYDPNRNQYHSTPILDKLAGVLDPEMDRVVALTSVDLFIPILTHVYGEAQLGGKSCIVSVSRLKKGLESEDTQDAYYDRIVKEVLHELGHTFNLLHCKDRKCIMHYCRRIEDVDRKSNQLCRYCKVLLEDQRKPSGKSGSI
ncbi:MAG: archaemetzincin family Zn-dependent metalloprotease [Proteobacteria bacterium]|nr:archaemetzincin family Zn-dependent metalloprotease [Pseudomonadota bacterium]